jgi:hypothetical protein
MTNKTAVNWKDNLEYITQELANGISPAKLAKHYGVSRQRILQVFKKYHILYKRVFVTKPEKPSKVVHNRILYNKFLRKKAFATKLGIPFSIEFNDVVWPKECPALRVDLDYNNDTDYAPSFDRILPEFGYIKGNVYIISKRANRIKNDGTGAELLGIVNYILTTLEKSKQ